MQPVNIDPEFQLLIPPLSREEQAGLEQDIVDHGCNEPLTVWRNEQGELMVLDGHNRLDICMRWRIEYEVHELEFDSRDEATLWMLRHQLNRRNITPVQRIELALIMEPLVEAESKARMEAGTKADPPLIKGEGIDKHAGETISTIAKMAGVGRDTVRKVKKVKELGDKKLAEDMKSGKISINKAYEKVEAPKTRPVEEYEPPIDEAGNIIPPDLVSVFGDYRIMLDGMRASLNKLARDSKDIFDEKGFGVWLTGGSRQAFNRDIANLKQAIKFARPYAVCPLCEGKGKTCKPCRNTGWMNKEVYGNLPKELKDD